MGKTFYGGQAVMEGVMMRGRADYAVAVREPSGAIRVLAEPLRSRFLTSRWARLPFVRGFALLWEMLSLGMRCLFWSANVQLAEEKQELSPGHIGGTLLVSLAFGIGLFFLLPLGLTSLADSLVHSDLLSNAIEGVIRLGILVGYIVAVGRIPEIRRVFAYHGAEHKVVHAHEAGVPLTPENAARFPLEHPRCGTGFLLIVMLLSVAVFSLLGRPELPVRIASRIVLVPFIAAVAYELIRFAANHIGNPVVRALMAPSLALQRLTTREPDAAQLEVAIVALERVLEMERARAAGTPEPAPSEAPEAATAPQPVEAAAR